MAGKSESLTTAFAGALDALPRHWPRTHWIRHEAGPDTVEFVNGDFKMRFQRVADCWEFTGTDDAKAASRRLWWLWVLAGVVVAALVVAVAVSGGNAWWVGGAVGLVAAVARSLLHQGRSWRRRGSRIPIGYAPEDDV
jgi:hypothetical protein